MQSPWPFVSVHVCLRPLVFCPIINKIFRQPIPLFLTLPLKKLQMHYRFLKQRRVNLINRREKPDLAQLHRYINIVTKKTLWRQKDRKTTVTQIVRNRRGSGVSKSKRYEDDNIYEKKPRSNLHSVGPQIRFCCQNTYVLSIILNASVVTRLCFRYCVL